MASTTPLDIPFARATSERRVYTWAAIAAFVVILAGFSPSYYLKPFFATPELTTLKHVHGVVMTAWFVLFFVQVRLVASGRVLVHRQLGILGVLVAILVVLVGMATAIASARAGVTPLPSIPPLVFFVMPVGEMVVFTALVTAAIVLRKRPAFHKRLMLVATLAMLTPAMARLPLEFVAKGGPPAFFALTDLVIIACLVYDAVKNRRVHPAFVAGLVVVIAGQAGRLVLSQTPQWMAFAQWLTQ